MGKVTFWTALSVFTAQFTPILWTPAAIFVVLYRLARSTPRSHPFTWGLTALYLTFMIFDKNTPNVNPRTSSIARSIPLWDRGREYFHGQFIKQAPLRRDRTYLFAMHPHSVLCFAVWVNYVSNKHAFPELRHTRLATISSHFTTPFMRDIFMSLGFVPATKTALTNGLKTDQNVALIIGGASEAQHNSHKAVRLILHKRLGFVRISLEADSPTLILFHFNEQATFKMPIEPTVADANDTQIKSNSFSQRFKNGVLTFQQRFLATFGFSLPIATGVCGPLPYPRDTTTMSGDYPIDFRVLVEFYYFLAKNNLYLGFTPQCPLDLLNLPHSHHTPTAQDVPYKYPHCTFCNKTNSTASSFITKTSSICTPPSHTLIETGPFPIEYMIQQSTIPNYLNQLRQAPDSKKKTELLEKYEKYTIELQNQHLKYTSSASSLSSTSQQKDIQPVVNKPCFLEEVLLIPILPISSLSSNSSSHTAPQPIPIDLSSYQDSTSCLTEINKNIIYEDVVAKWTHIPQIIVRWLLFIYIGELSYFYDKYNTHNKVPLEIVDFDFMKFCNETCGLNQKDVPSDLCSKYRYGININEYLLLFGYNRKYIIDQLRIFLTLKQDPIGISLDGKSDVPYPPEPALL